MKKIIGGITALILLVVGACFWHINHSEARTELNELAGLTKAGFAALDNQLAMCTVARFEFGISDTTRPVSPLFDNLGDYHVPISTYNDCGPGFF